MARRRRRMLDHTSAVSSIQLWRGWHLCYSSTAAQIVVWTQHASRPGLRCLKGSRVSSKLSCTHTNTTHIPQTEWSCKTSHHGAGLGQLPKTCVAYDGWSHSRNTMDSLSKYTGAVVSFEPFGLGARAAGRASGWRSIVEWKADLVLLFQRPG